MNRRADPLTNPHAQGQMQASTDALSSDVADVSALASRPIKRSFSIAGHRTSISLEAAFWDAFRELCEADGIAMAARLAEIDRARGHQSGLSGAVRVWILARYRGGVANEET